MQKRVGWTASQHGYIESIMILEFNTFWKIFANTRFLQQLRTSLGKQRLYNPHLHLSTSGFAKGNYAIGVYAWPVSGKTGTDDNLFIDGWVSVVKLGDVNADGIVDIFDCVIVALASDSTPSDLNWNSNADIDNNGVVDIFDMVVVVLHFGETS